MPKRLARKPSTASLAPAAKNSRNAIRISPEVMAQITTGTSRMRASVMRLGMLNFVRPGSRTDPAPAHSSPVFQYSGDRAVAQSAIPKYLKPRTAPSMPWRTTASPMRSPGSRLLEAARARRLNHDQEARCRADLGPRFQYGGADRGRQGRELPGRRRAGAVQPPGHRW